MSVVLTSPSWRVSVDRAWRSLVMRNQFEAECRFSPLADGATEREAQQLSGYTQSYYDSFLVWATRHLGLESQAPAFIQEKLLASSMHDE